MRGETGILPVMEVGNNNGFNGFGGDGAWWIIILLLFGWGRNGFGGNNDGGYYNGFGAPNIYGKLDGISNGICDLGFNLATNMNNGFANVQQTLCQGFGGVNTALVQNGYETRGAITDLGYRLQDCCCQTQRAIDNCCCTTQRSIDNVNFNLSQIGCGITNTINNATRDLIDNQNANYRALHDEIVANRIEDKNAQIQAQQNEINALRLKASQEAQNTYLLSELKPCPSPSYIVPNPNCCYQYNVAPINNCNSCY